MNNTQDLLGIEKPLPENFANIVATGLANKKMSYDNAYYPGTFIDVRMVVANAQNLSRLKRWIDNVQRAAVSYKWSNYMSIYKVDEYEILENTMATVNSDWYKAKLKSMAAEQAIAESGELARNII